MKFNESGDGNWLFRALSRGITCTPNYHGSIRNTVVQHINDNIERYQDFFTIDPNIYISKMFKLGTWGGEAEIQAFTEVYSVNVYVHELKSTLEPSYRYLNPGASIHPIRLIYRNNDHYNSLTTKSDDYINEPQKSIKKLPKI